MNKITKVLGRDEAFDILEPIATRVDRLAERAANLAKLDAKFGPWCLVGTHAHEHRKPEIVNSARLVRPQIRRARSVRGA